jgi:hypothetical protein
MAVTLDNGVFWLVLLDKAVTQIHTAIKKKKRVSYVSKQWKLVAWVLKLSRAWFLNKSNVKLNVSSFDFGFNRNRILNI